MDRYYPPLKDIVSLDTLPEQLSFIEHARGNQYIWLPDPQHTTQWNVIKKQLPGTVFYSCHLQ